MIIKPVRTQIIFLFTVLTMTAAAQYFPNRSFEGTPTPALPPPGWQICTPGWSTPDVQPGNFGVYLAPSDGNTYLGMTARDDYTWEDVHATLNTPFSMDSCYVFKIDLAYQQDVATYNMLPIVLKIYGSNTFCDKTNLLWQSPAVSNLNWETYEFTIHPDAYDITDIVLEAFYTGTTPYWGYILMDNIVVYTTPEVDLGEDTIVAACESDSLLLNAGGGQAAYLWSGGSTDSTLAVDSTGYYWVQVTGPEGCTASDTIYVEFEEYVDMTTQMLDSTLVCQDQQIQLSVNVQNGIAPYFYYWPGIDDSANPVIVYPDSTTTYVVEVSDHCGMTVSDSIKVVVLQGPDIDLGEDMIICSGQDTVLNAGSGYNTYLWQNGSTDSIITINSSGWYWVQVTSQFGCTSTDSIYVSYFPFTPPDLGGDTVICADESLTLNAGSGYVSYLWQNNSSSQTFTLNEPGTYWVTVTDDNGCQGTDSIHVDYAPAVTMSLGPDTTICSGDSFSLTPGTDFQSYLWQNGETTPYLSITNSGTYWVEVVDPFGCTNADTINIDVNPSPVVDLGADTVICDGAELTLEPIGQFSSYLWQDNSNLPFYTVTSTGFYSVTVTNLYNCEASDEIYVETSNPQVNFGTDSLLCTGDTIILDAGAGYAVYLWQDSTSSRFYPVVHAGTYSVNIEDQFGCKNNGEIIVNELPKPTADLGGDQSFCKGDSLILTAPEGPFQYVWNGSTGGQTLKVTTGGNYTLQVSNDCGTAEDVISIDEFQIPDVSLGPDRLLTGQETTTLDAGTGYDSYVWQDGSTGQTYTVESGMLNPDNPYYFVEVSKNGCMNSDTVKILLFQVRVPIVITPNGDQENDKFIPDPEKWQGINKHHIEVFNRWGEKVWESDHFEDGWDGKQNGKPVADGTYFWVLDVYYGNDNLRQTVKGSLTILGTP